METFAAWSQRIFGVLVSPTADADGDGLNNNGEFIAGTDPRDPRSRLTIKTFAPLPGGGFAFTWDTVAGRTYAVERSLNLQTWTSLQIGLPGTGTTRSYTDPTPPASPRIFYRVSAED